MYLLKFSFLMILSLLFVLFVAHTNNHFLILSLYDVCNEFSRYCDDGEGYARLSSLLFACVCVCYDVLLLFDSDE